MPDDTLLCNQCTLTLDPGTADSYLWNNNSESRYLEVSTPGIYRVKMENNQCTVYDSILVYMKEPVVVLPNAFTPNNDGLNDHFKPVVSDALTGYKMWIYNRLGTALFYTENLSEGWDGSYKGSICPPSTYIWKINYTTYNKQGRLVSKTQQGFVTIVR